MDGRDKPGHDGVRELKRTSAPLRENPFRTQTKTARRCRERFGLGAIPELKKMYATTVTVTRTK
jgi:hypothetical protein